MEQVAQTVIEYKAAIVALWLLLFLGAERLLPATTRPDDERRVGRNAGLWLVNTVMSVMIILPLSAGATEMGPDWRPAWWAGAGGLVLDLVILDGLIYLWHRANHEIPLLWRFHEIHHLDGFLDTTSAVRFHFGEVLLSAGFRAAVIIALDMPFASIVVFEALVLLAAVFHHSNLRLPAALERALGWLVVTPAIHWVHHHAVDRDTRSNYAPSLSLWDPLGGTRSATRRHEAMPIGLPEARDQAVGALLLRPFRRR